MKTKLTIIMVVDVQELNLEFSQLCREAEFTIVAFDSAFEAQVYIKTVGIPSLIILDMDLPETSSYALCEQLKADDFTSQIPLIFTTEQPSIERELKALSLGAVDFVSKPFSPKLLKAKIDLHLTQRERQDTLETTTKEIKVELQLVQAMLLEGLGTLAEYRDADTGSHIKRTQNYVKALAAELQKTDKHRHILTADTIELLYNSASLHDIGKVGVSDAILLKKGKLTEKEFAEIEKHPSDGYEVLRKIGSKLKNNAFLKHATDIAYTHHERWDGKGYPQGLSGSDIPLSGRLMAVADVYDALISKRPYKEPFSHTKVVQMIVADKGHQFDPDVVDAFITQEKTFKNIATTYSNQAKELHGVVEGSTVKNFGQNIKRLLLVEDNEINREIMQAQIESLGIYVETAHNGNEALKMVDENSYDVVLTDLKMPEMDGYQLVKRLKESIPTLPVYAISSSYFEVTGSELVEYGFRDHMIKPFDINVLKHKLSSLG